MTKMPMPAAPDRRTARQMIRAAQMTGADPASMLAYFCVTVDRTGELAIAGNVQRDQLRYLLTSLLRQLESGQLERIEHEEDEPPERPGLN